MEMEIVVKCLMFIPVKDEAGSSFLVGSEPILLLIPFFYLSCFPLSIYRLPLPENPLTVCAFYFSVLDRYIENHCHLM